MTGHFNEWQAFVPELQRGDHLPLLDAICALRNSGKSIYPAQEHIFRALELVSPQDVKVIILGQDPYHGAGQAQGLAFSVPEHCAMPPSLRNIFREVAQDCGQEHAPNPDLSRWARQGVLLLNTVLSVEAGKPLSHEKLGWQAITQGILRSLAKRGDNAQGTLHPLAVLLWGKQAAKFAHFFDTPHKVFLAPHPSPLSAHSGFFGCKHFSLVNAWLQAQERTPITW